MTDEDLLAAVCAKEPLAKPDAEAGLPAPAYGYIRVSTEEQAESGLGLEAQTDAITRYCQLKRLHLLGVIADEAKSGKTTIASRPHGGSLCEQLNCGDHIIFAKHDRGLRNTLDMLQTTQGWTDRGIVTHIVNWAIDTRQPFWKLFAPLAAAIAEWEIGMGGERVREAIRAKRRRGERWVRCAPRGFKWIPNPKGGKSKRGNPAMILAPDEPQLAQMRQIAQWRQDGLSYNKIWRMFLLRRERRASDGKEWDIHSIWLAHKRYCEYQALKAQNMGRVI
jgi:DNA invertase Pin-like site-specific DNA recombinase